MAKIPKDPGPFREYKYIPDKHIERAALQALVDTRLMPTCPSKVEIEKFCDRKWGAPEDYRDLGPDYLGRATFRITGLASIEVNARLEEDKSRVGVCRLRSTTAHEIGHGVLHEAMFVDKIKFDQEQMTLFAEVERQRKPADQTVIATRPNTIDSGRPPFEWWEYQANLFMAEILMPKPLFLEVVNARLDTEKVLAPRRPWEINLDVSHAKEDLVEAFGVSNQMAQIAVSRHVKAIRKQGERALPQW